MKSGLMASWHVYHRKFARFHSPDKSRYDRRCTVCLNCSPLPLWCCPLFICVCMHARWSMGETEWIERTERNWAFFWEKGGKEHHDSGGGPACRTVGEGRAGMRGALCDDLVEETGLFARHSLETEKIFYFEDLNWIIQVKWSDLV